LQKRTPLCERQNRGGEEGKLVSQKHKTKVIQQNPGKQLRALVLAKSKKKRDEGITLQVEVNMHDYQPQLPPGCGERGHQTNDKTTHFFFFLGVQKKPAGNAVG